MNLLKLIFLSVLILFLSCSKSNPRNENDFSGNWKSVNEDSLTVELGGQNFNILTNKSSRPNENLWYWKALTTSVSEDELLLLQLPQTTPSSELWVNGKKLPSRYTSKSSVFDMTHYIIESSDAQNICLLKTTLDSSQQHSIPNIKLIKLNKLHIPIDGTVACTYPNSDNSTITLALDVNVRNAYGIEKQCTLESYILNERKSIVAESTTPLFLNANQQNQYKQIFTVHPENKENTVGKYTAVCKLVRQETIIDAYNIDFDTVNQNRFTLNAK